MNARHPAEVGRVLIPPKSSVPGLDRGLDVLECMAKSEQSLSLTAIARRLGCNVSQVQRTVALLTLRGYLERDRHGFRLSSKLFRVASSYPPFRDLVEQAIGPMQSFADETAESVHLGVLSHDRLLLVAQVEGHGLVRVSLELGGFQDAFSTVSGRILLSALTAAEWDAFSVRHALSRDDRRRLEHELGRIRQAGHAQDESQAVCGVQDLGVPVALEAGLVPAALTTSWLPTRRGPSRVAELLDALKQAARRIEATPAVPLDRSAAAGE